MTVEEGCELTGLRKALGTSETWGEFRARVPKERYEEALEPLPQNRGSEYCWNQEEQGRKKERERRRRREEYETRRVPTDGGGWVEMTLHESE